MEEQDQQLYRRPQMTGQTRDEEEEAARLVPFLTIVDLNYNVLAGLPGSASLQHNYIYSCILFRIYFLFFFSGDRGIPHTFDEMLTPLKPKTFPLLNPASKCSPWCLMGPICSTCVHSQIHLHYMCNIYSQSVQPFDHISQAFELLTP